MTPLGEVLELMYGARERFVPFRVVVRQWTDGAGFRRAEERFAATPEGRAEDWHLLVEARSARGAFADYEAASSLWIEGPERMRERTEAVGHPTYEHVRGRNESHWIDDWLDPMRLLGSLEVEPTLERSVAGRPALTLLTRRRSHLEAMGQLTLFLLGRGADAYELEVDAELGILTRTAALLDGETYQVREALELASDG